MAWRVDMFNFCDICNINYLNRTKCQVASPNILCPRAGLTVNYIGTQIASVPIPTSAAVGDSSRVLTYSRVIFRTPLSSQTGLVDGVDVLTRQHRHAASRVFQKASLKGRASLLEVTVIRIGAASRVFQRHGACANGAVIFRKKLTRVQRLAFMSQQLTCLVAMEACARAHCWGGEIEKLGRMVRLIAPNYVKPFVKRQMNDVADAEAVVEAAR
jgi:hypothetical protein